MLPKYGSGHTILEENDFSFQSFGLVPNNGKNRSA